MRKSSSYEVVCFGEALWDMLPTGKRLGGAPLNVAYHLQQLGKSVAVISKIGKDDLGKQMLNELSAKKIRTTFFQADDDHPTSVVQADIADQHEVVYTIVENVAWDFIEYTNDLKNLVSNSHYFVFGTLASRNHKTRNTLLQLLNVAKIKVLDINLRPPFYDRELVESMLIQADIVKMNRHELALLSAWFSAATDDRDRQQALKERFQIKTTIVTDGAKGATVLTEEGFFSCSGVPVTVADTVGSGDAFLAAFIARTIDGASTGEALKFANLLAAFITTKDGACPDYTTHDISFSQIG